MYSKIDHYNGKINMYMDTYKLMYSSIERRINIC